jgi:hypothetical protein
MTYKAANSGKALSFMNAASPIDDFLAGRSPAFCNNPSAPQPKVVLPGSFNPLHAGHIKLAEVASELLGHPTAFELSIVNADKPPIERAEVDRRLHQFGGRLIWLTRAPTFLEKARLFPDAVFVVGADTAARILSPRYYPETNLDLAINQLRGSGCRFLVAGRVDGSGLLLTLDDLPVSAAHRDLFSTIPTNVFRMDLSSTQLRRPLS